LASPKPVPINPHNLPKANFHEDKNAGMPDGIEFHPPFLDRRTGLEYDDVTATAWDERFELYDMRGFWRGGRGLGPVSRGTTPLGRGYVESIVDRPLLIAYMEAGSSAPRQMDVYLLVVVQGISIRKAATRLGIDRSEVRTHIKRLQRKAERWRDGHDRMHRYTGRSG
jgi:DNA-binding CsgD family transcriptional regulator